MNAFAESDLVAFGFFRKKAAEQFGQLLWKLVRLRCIFGALWESLRHMFWMCDLVSVSGL
ncbi:MAG: hypothetical protein EBR93_04110 [Bacteroidetes bacterium]|nr:hypothetical protein [Bacteroidota bacterium]